MIPVLIRIGQISLRRDRVAQVMTFVLPIAFFSIFANVFGRASMDNTSRIRVAVVDEDHSDQSRALLAALDADPSLRVRDSARAGTAKDAPLVPLDRARAQTLLRSGDYPVGLILPKGWGATFPNLMRTEVVRAEILNDPSDPVARQIFTGLLQRAGASAMRGAFGQPAGGPPTEEIAPVRVQVHDVLGDTKRRGQMISFYAAGIAVMFLLFSCSSAGGVLIDEQDSGTLERVLNTNVGMTGLLAGKWAHITLLGMMQITVMFLWGMLVFQLDLLRHLPGFIIMTAFTAAAAAAFGLVLATLCRTRAQLSGFATLLILVMSALGGSMFPRFLMSEGMQKMGLATFNAWALDGYLKVFWREAPLVELWPQLLVLGGLTALFLVSARLLARRWEAV